MTLVNPPEFLQSANEDYDARRLRWMFRGLIGEGAGSSADFRVSQRAAGANLSVDVAAGRGWVEGDDTARQGIYHIYGDATENKTVAAADATNPRIDRVVLRIYDNTIIGGGIDEARVEVLAGTPTAGATTGNLTGAAAVPSSALLLANVLVDAGAASIADAKIANVAPVAALGGSTGGPRDVVLYQPVALLVWTNMPSALTEFPSTVLPRAAFDLTGFTQGRLVAQQGVAGSTNAELRVQYSTDQAAWSYLDAASGPGVAVGAGASTIKRGAWVSLAAAAKADIYLRLVGINGDGAADPSFGRVALQVR